MREFLREIEETGMSILNEDKKNGTINILAPFVQADKLNKNHRKYPLALLNREIDKVQDQINSGSFIGMSDHPASGMGNVQNASHLINKMFLDASGKGFVEMKILATEKGKNIQAILKGGGKLGLSSRGFGTVNPTTRIVADDFNLVGVDIVMNPSEPEATFDMKNIFESIDFAPKKEDKKGDNKMDMKSKERILNTIYSRDINNGTFVGSFEDYKQKNEKFIDIALCEVNEGLSYEDSVRKVLGDEKGQRVLNKEKQIQEKVEIKDIIFEANVAGISPSEYVKKLNKEIDRQNQKILDDDEEQKSYILREAAMAGANINDPDVKKKILENFAKQKNEPVKILTEKEKAKFKDQEEVRKYDYLVGEKMAAGYKGK